MSLNNKELIKALKNDDEVRETIINIVKEYDEKQREQKKNHNSYEMPQTNITESMKQFIGRKEENAEELYKKIQELEKQKEQLQEKVNEEIRKKEQIIQNAERQLIDKCKEIEVKDKEIADKNREINAKNEEIAAKTNEIEKISTDITTQIKEKEHYKKELEHTRTALEKMQENYQKSDEIYQLYLSLDSVVHSRLQRVLNPGKLPCESAEIFFAYGVQEGNITALWDVISLHVTDYQISGELESLLRIFEYFLRIFKEVSYRTVEVCQPQIGAEFDERYHTRTPDSRVSGRIEKVIIPGFTIGQNTARKPLVYVA